jgi:hypothetical protein
VVVARTWVTVNNAPAIVAVALMLNEVAVDALELDAAAFHATVIRFEPVYAVLSVHPA